MTLRNEVGPWPWLTLVRSGDAVRDRQRPGHSVGRDGEIPSRQRRAGDGVWIGQLELTRRRTLTQSERRGSRVRS